MTEPIEERFLAKDLALANAVSGDIGRCAAELCHSRGNPKSFAKLLAKESFIPSVFLTDTNDPLFVAPFYGNIEPCLVRNQKEIAVVRGTGIALPYDAERDQFYIKLGGTKSFWNWRVDGSTEIRGKQHPSEWIIQNSKTIPDPQYRRLNIHSFSEAFKAPIPSEVAAWWLEKQPDGNRTVFLENKKQEKRRNGCLSQKDFRRAATHAFLKEWGESLAVRKVYDLKKWGPHTMQIHHVVPTFCGGTDEWRMYIPSDFHRFIHQMFFARLSEAYQILNLPFSPSSPIKTKTIAKAMDRQPDAVEQLVELPHVSVGDNGELGIDILNPPGDLYFIPGLMVFEKQEALKGAMDPYRAEPLELFSKTTFQQKLHV
ncbi:MAG: hypothetical protein PHS57_04150 [Alphaproteobacteria bacterium]|nr:hypothetical protein [Alphaproteobacteria bacterium]